MSFSNISNDDNRTKDYIFEYENLYLEYNSRKTILYKKNSDNNYEILLESSLTDDGLENSSLYSKDSAYVLSEYNPETGSINFLDRFSKADFTKSINMLQNNNKNKILKNVHQLSGALFTMLHCDHLVSNGNSLKSPSNDYYFKEYRRLFINYKYATICIPVYNILNNIVFDIFDYVVSGQIDIENIKSKLADLQPFSRVCSNSISLISSFIENPESTDLRNLCNRS